MPDSSTAGGARVSRRALVDVIRPAVAGSYGVTGFVAHGLLERLLGLLRLEEPGVRVSFDGGLAVELDLTVAYGLPVAEVARQAESAARYALRRAIGREPDRIVVHVGGMRFAHGHPDPAETDGPGTSSAESPSARVPPDVLGAPPPDEDLLDVLGGREGDADELPRAEGA